MQKRTEVKLLELPMVLRACCVLHNICEMSNEELDSELQIGKHPKKKLESEGFTDHTKVDNSSVLSGDTAEKQTGMEEYQF